MHPLFCIIAAVGQHSPVWHEAKTFGSALLHGKASYTSGEQTLDYYNRLPASAANTTRSAIWSLSQQPAGQFLQFSTNSTSISIRYTLGHASLSMWHFASTGVSGVDCYSYDETTTTWRWTGTAKPTYPTTVATLATLRAAETRRYRIHLPTYNTVTDDLAIGLDAGSALVPDSSTLSGFEDGEAIVWYGSSILQGAVASRPGQIATHEVSRELKRLVYNFGFSGSCWMEVSVAQYLAAITPKPGLFIVDCNPNMVRSPMATPPLCAPPTTCRCFLHPASPPESPPPIAASRDGSLGTTTLLSPRVRCRSSRICASTATRQRLSSWQKEHRMVLSGRASPHVRCRATRARLCERRSTI